MNETSEWVCARPHEPYLWLVANSLLVRHCWSVQLQCVVAVVLFEMCTLKLTDHVVANIQLNLSAPNRMAHQVIATRHFLPSILLLLFSPSILYSVVIFQHIFTWNWVISAIERSNSAGCFALTRQKCTRFEWDDRHRVRASLNTFDYYQHSPSI